MPRIRLLSLKCHETEDSWGSDHVYILADNISMLGTMRFPWISNREIPVMLSMHEGSLPQDLRRFPEFPFVDSVQIQLYDQDDNDADDVLGTFTVYESMVGSRQRASFDQDDGNYTLIFDVLAD